MSKNFTTIPLTLSEANDFVTEHHRHNKKCQGHRFSIGCIKDNELVGEVIKFIEKDKKRPICSPQS